jgi:signal transduction histidine kinase
MKLTAKIALLLVALVCAILYLNARAQTQEAMARYGNDMRDDAFEVGRLFRPMIARAWRTEGKSSAMYLIQYTNESLKSQALETRMHLRWVWLDEQTDAGLRPTVPLAQLESVRHGHEASFLVRETNGEMRYSYVPVHVGIDGEPPGALEISESLASVIAYSRAIRKKLFANATVLGALCTLFVLVIGAWFIGRPMRTLSAVANRIGHGDFSARVQLRQRDEVGELGRAMNDMAEKLEAAQINLAHAHEERILAVEQLRHADRLSSIGTLASGIAHELGTPLAVITGRAKLLVDGQVAADEIKKQGESIHKQAERMAAIIRNLLDFARKGNVKMERMDLLPVVKQTVDWLQPIARKREASVTLNTNDRPFFVQADNVLLQQVMTNLVLNALDAMPHGGNVGIDIEETRVKPPIEHGGEVGDFIACHVTDTGQGIRPETLPKLFEPFFTTKPVGQGTGLGLAVTYGIVKEHGGWVAVDSRVGQGSRFSIFLPRAA